MADLPPAGATMLHPPAGAARPRPRGLVRARHRRRRAVRRAAARHGHDGGARAATRCLAQCVEAYERHRRQHHRGRGGLAARRRTSTASSRSARTTATPSRSPAWSKSRRKGTAPSNLIISGRYILQPEIFEFLETVEKGAGGEIQLTDGMMALAKRQAFHGVRFDGRTYDCGSKLGFLTANVAFALDRPDLEPALRAEIAGSAAAGRRKKRGLALSAAGAGRA